YFAIMLLKEEIMSQSATAAAGNELVVAPFQPENENHDSLAKQKLRNSRVQLNNRRMLTLTISDRKWAPGCFQARDLTIRLTIGIEACQVSGLWNPGVGDFH